MHILNVKVERHVVEKLEKLVRRNVYKNKSEAVRKMLEEHLEEHPELFAPDRLLQELSKKAYDEGMNDQQYEKLAANVFRGPKTAAQLVAEERDRQ